MGLRAAAVLRLCHACPDVTGAVVRPDRRGPPSVEQALGTDRDARDERGDVDHARASDPDGAAERGPRAVRADVSAQATRVLNEERFGTSPLGRAELEALSETLRRVRIDAGDFEDGLSRSNAG